MRRAAVYMRVSSAPQLEKFGPAVQIATMEAYAARNSLQLIATYEDAITGKAARRERLDALLKEAARYDVVIVSSVDRLARRVPVAYGVVGEMLEAGLEVHSADMGPIDLDDESSNIQFGVRALFADADHRKIARRMHEARIRKVASGTPERPLGLYGWRKGEPVEAEQHWLRWMYARAAQVGSFTIALELNEQGVRTRTGRPWSAELVRHMLGNPTYRGEYQFGRSRGTVRAVCAVPAVVTPEVWAAANARTHRKSINRADRFPLIGHLFCGECGCAVGGMEMKGGRYLYYGCSSVTRFRIADNPCTNTARRPADQVHDTIRAALSGLAEDHAALAQAIHTPTVPPVDTRALTADVQRRLTRLDAAYEAGAYDAQEYAEKRRALLAERAALEQQPTQGLSTPPNIEAARAKLKAALASSDLGEIAAAVHLRVTVWEGWRIAVQVGGTA